MFNVYRKFFKYFTTIAAPLNKLLEKAPSDSIEILTDYQQLVFDIIKQKLASPLVLAVHRAYLPYVLDTDANAEKIGCVLSQSYTPKDPILIGYYSKTLTDIERNYDRNEREFLVSSPPSSAILLLDKFYNAH